MLPCKKPECPWLTLQLIPGNKREQSWHKSPLLVLMLAPDGWALLTVPLCRTWWRQRGSNVCHEITKTSAMSWQCSGSLITGAAAREPNSEQGEVRRSTLFFTEHIFETGRQQLLSFSLAMTLENSWWGSAAYGSLLKMIWLSAVLKSALLSRCFVCGFWVAQLVLDLHCLLVRQLANDIIKWKSNVIETTSGHST